MRAVKTVLLMAGKIKRQDRDGEEDVILIKAMRDSNVPKFLTHDLPLFFGIIQDLFPTTKVPFSDYGKLQSAIENQLRLEKKQIVQPFITKII
jgi:dynein heavy chain